MMATSGYTKFVDFAKLVLVLPNDYFFWKSPIFTLELSQKSDFQLSTTKSDNIGHPTVKTGQIWPLGGFEGGFAFSKKIK